MNNWKQTEFGNIPEDWAVLKFSEALKIKGRIGWKGYKTSDLRDSGPVVIGGVNIKSNIYLNYSSISFLSREKYEESPEIMLKKGDVILVTRGNGIGDVGLFNGEYYEATINPSVVILSDFKGDSKFLYYFLASPQGNEQVMSLEGGSSIPALYQGLLKTLELPFPEKKIQEGIVSVLSSLDDKIDLLNRQNATLEKMAETLFRQWFVEEAKEEWEETTLSYFADFFNGKVRPTEEGLIPIYGGNGILGYTNKSNYSGKSIIVGRVGAYCGSLYYENKDIWVSDNALLVKAKIDNTVHFLFYLLKTLDLNSMAEGSSHPLLTQTLLKTVGIKRPPLQRIKEFDLSIEIIHNKIDKNQSQIRTLTTLRDTLLPKLMSGEVRVGV